MRHTYVIVSQTLLLQIKIAITQKIRAKIFRFSHFHQWDFPEGEVTKVRWLIALRGWPYLRQQLETNGNLHSGQRFVEPKCAIS